MWNETLFFEIGSTYLQHDSALEHTKSDAHKAAFEIYLRAEGYDVSERSERCSFLGLCEKREGDKKDEP